MDLDDKRRRDSERGKAYYAAHRERILARQIARSRTEHAKAINRKAVAKYRAAHKAEQAVQRKARRLAKIQADPEGFRQQERTARRQSYYANVECERARANAYGTKHAKVRARRAADWRVRNPERVHELSVRAREKRKERWIAFLEQERERYRRGYQLDPGKYSAKGAARRSAKLQATPPWADLRAIVEIYRQAQQLSRETGIKHDVDHIVPLRGKTVWGLHIPINLQILTSTANRRKLNKVDASTATHDHHPVLTAGVAKEAD